MKSSRRDTTSINRSIAEVLAALEGVACDAVVFSNQGPVLFAGGEARYKALEYLFGFSDESGACLFFKGKLYFFADSRFELELHQLFSGISDVTIQIVKADPVEFAWSTLANLALKSDTPLNVAIDRDVIHSISFLKLDDSKSANVNFREIDLLARIWKDRPASKDYRIRDIEDMVFEGSYEKILTPRATKLSLLSAQFIALKPNAFILSTSPSDISYFLNIRTFDNEPSLLVKAYLLLSSEKGYLFIQGEVPSQLRYDLSKITEDRIGIKEILVFPFEDFKTKFNFLIPYNSPVYLFDNEFSASLVTLLKQGNYELRTLNKISFERAKCTRTFEELKSIKLAFEKDSVAFIRFLFASEDGLINSELDAYNFLESERDKDKSYICSSFKTIAGFGTNSAIVHYFIDENNYKTFSQDSNDLLLIDFGSQYDYGTTDSTRTIVFGTPSEKQKKLYTAILKAKLYLHRIEYEENVNGLKLDFLCRALLYENNINVPHGIGHGVEFIGNVHDRYPRLSPSSAAGSLSLIDIGDSNVFTIEPGVYIENEFGIRLENTVYSSKDPKTSKISLTPLTLIPYDSKLILWDNLSEADIDYLQKYYEEIYSKLSKYFNDGEKERLKKLLTIPTRELNFNFN